MEEERNVTGAMKPDDSRRARRGRMTTAGVCVAAVVVMGGLAWASVPLYDLFCSVTGYGGTPRIGVDGGGPPVAAGRVRVRFDGNVARGLDWDFRPVTKPVTVRHGEVAEAIYRVRNRSAEAVTGQAVFNVTPAVAGYHFVKTECFCFTRQTLAAGESTDMKVVFFVDPEIVDDAAARDVRTITLSYTFFAGP